MKKLIALLLALVMCFSLLPLAAFAEEPEEEEKTLEEAVEEARIAAEIAKNRVLDAKERKLQSGRLIDTDASKNVNEISDKTIAKIDELYLSLYGEDNETIIVDITVEDVEALIAQINQIADDSVSKIEAVEVGGFAIGIFSKVFPIVMEYTDWKDIFQQSAFSTILSFFSSVLSFFANVFNPYTNRV